MKTSATRDCLEDEGTVWKPKCVVESGAYCFGISCCCPCARRREQERQRYGGRELRRRWVRRVEVRVRVGVGMVDDNWKSFTKSGTDGNFYHKANAPDILDG